MHGIVSPDRCFKILQTFCRRGRSSIRNANALRQHFYTGDNFMKSLINAVAVTVLCAGLTFAQGPYGGRTSTTTTSGNGITREVNRLTTLLDLSTAQVASVTGFLTTAQTAAAAAQATIKTDRTALATAITTANSGATITSLSTAIGVAEGQILAARAGAAASIYGVLLPAQQTKFTSLGGLGLLGGGGQSFGGGRGAGRIRGNGPGAN